MKDVSNDTTPNYTMKHDPGLLVSIVIPVIRPKNMPRMMKIIKKHAGVPDSVYEVLTAVDDQRIGCPLMVKAMVEKSRAPMVMFLGDDCLPWPNFLRNALQMMKTFPDGWGLVGLNDQHHDGNKLATHWLAHKALLPHLGGEFFNTSYQHCFCDQELTARAKEIGRYKWAEKAKLKHRNPIIDDSVELDDDYRRVYAKKVYEADQNLFIRRLESGWAYNRPRIISGGRKIIAIGVPSYRKGEDEFNACLKEMRQYSLSHGIHTVLIRRRGSIIHHSRNAIIGNVRKDYPMCSNLMMIDDDMTFPPETLVNMLAHDKEFLCCNAYRKVPPFAPIAQIWDKEDERFFTLHTDPAKGKLRRISTCGTGLVLFNMEIFDKIKFPWFEFAYAREDDPKNPQYIEGHVLIGEDTNFCFKAADADIGLYCDFSIDVGHILVDDEDNRQIINWRTHEEACQKLERQSDKEPSALLALP